MRARAVEFTGPRRARVVDVLLDEPGRGEIEVRTLYSGISSGTEMLVYRGDVDAGLVLDETIPALRGAFSYPLRYGYSSVGVVAGSQADVAPGTLVFAFHPHQDRFVTAAAEAVILPGTDPRTATMFPLVETAFQIALDAGEVSGESVVIAGLGVVGLLTALLLQRAGAHVLGVEPSTERRDAAADLGVDAVVPEDAVERVRALSGGRGVPLVVEASGDPAALASALPMLAHEGTALVASWYGTRSVTLPLGAEFHRRRLTIRSTQVSTIPARLSSRWTIARRRRHVVGLLEELPLKGLATHEFGFERAPDAFAALDRGDPGLIHVALAYEQT